MKANKNRKEKIQFLKGVLKGQNTITELYPNSYEVFINRGTNPGKYYNPGNPNIFFTREELTEYEMKHPWKEIVIINVNYHYPKYEDKHKRE